MNFSVCLERSSKCTVVQRRFESNCSASDSPNSLPMSGYDRKSSRIVDLLEMSH